MQRLIIKMSQLTTVIDSSALETLLSHRQTGTALEACGVLLGMHWDNLVQVTVATHPQKHDLRHRTGYVRSRSGHLAIARDAWKESNGLVGYLGEWHSHPEEHANPSSLDLQSSTAIARRNKTNVVSIIVGLASSYLYLSDGNGVIGHARF
ncbi:hypothetical protein D9M73_64430 [compost metagenome]